MATPTTASRTAPSARRTTAIPPRSTPSPSSSPTPLAVKGATARSAVSPRSAAGAASGVTSPSRRASIRATAPTPIAAVLNGDSGNPTTEALAASLKRETEEKEQLLVRLQDKEQTITSLTADHDNLSSALTSAETRLQQLYADQARMEEEMVARLEVVEKLRTQVRELEKEKRDAQRRYNDQTQSFDAERQAFYDNEQHLKSRILSLSQARRARPKSPSIHENASSEDDVEEEDFDEPKTPVQPRETQKEDESTEPPEITALKLELSTLSTSYSSLQNTLQLLQSQLLDLKRVNNELQEENESYNILLREKTLSGQFDIFRTAAPTSTIDEEDEDDSKAESSSLRSTGRSTLDRVPEMEEPPYEEFQNGDESPSSRYSQRSSRRPRRGTATPPRGESLADLPITGPGLDLAAELGRAENKDILEGRSSIDGPSDKGTPSKRGRRKDSEPAINGEVDALRNEVKSLKDANKALSLYASKIIDRIIAQDGFEHVLAVDYDPPAGNASKPAKPKETQPKPRPQSVIVRSNTNVGNSSASTSTTAAPAPDNTGPAAPSEDAKRQRRSLSFDWKGFSMFGGGAPAEKKPDPNLRPLTLKAGTSIVGARKLDTMEDEEDRRERERMNATMKLMGIEKPAAAPPLVKAHSAPISSSMVEQNSSSPPVPAPAPAPTPSNRFSFFRSRSANSTTTSTLEPAPPPAELTQEALEQAEAQSKLAALDAREKVLSEEIAKGRGVGFTELSPRSSLGDEWRSRRGSRRSGGGLGSGSGSTVWSAGDDKE